jgi:cell division protein FtsL
MASPMHSIRPAAPRHAPGGAPAPAPGRERAPARTPDLRVVPTTRRRLRTGPTVVLGGVLAFLIAFGLVVAQAFLVQGQQRLDDLGQRMEEAERQREELRLRVAELESPSRIVEAATSQLGMVTPDSVTYLTPSGTSDVAEQPPAGETG